MVVVVLFLASCSMSANSDKNESGKVSEQKKGEVIVLNKADFLSKVFNYEKNPTQWMYEGDKPCIIDFYADWCGPCKRVAPVLVELAEQYKDDLIIYKINVDNEKELAMAFGIQSIPTLLFIPKTGTPQVSQGALSKEQFVEQIENFLLKKK
jgi:thioredoxin